MTPLAPSFHPLWPVMTPAPVTCAAESQKLCKLLPDFDIYGYSGFLGSHRNFFVALFDLAIGSEAGYECACPTLCTKFCRANTLGKHTLRVRLVFLHLSNELNPKSKELSELPPSHVQFTNFT